MKAGDIIQGTYSKCCHSSVSSIYGKHLGNKFIPFHWVCNNCKKNTIPYKKDTWLITKKLKYKRL